MYTGRYEHNLDSKGRLTLPKSLQIADKTDLKLIAIGDGSLWVITDKEFEARFAKLYNAEILGKPIRKAQRLLFSRTRNATVEDGRILIPQDTRKALGLEEAREVAVLGCGTHVEIWPVDKEPTEEDDRSEVGEEEEEDILMAVERFLGGPEE